MTRFEGAWNENIYDDAAQFMMHITMDVCSVSPAVKGCLPGWVEENTSTSRTAASDGIASPAKKDKTNVSGLLPLDV